MKRTVTVTMTVHLLAKGNKVSLTRSSKDWESSKVNDLGLPFSYIKGFAVTVSCENLL